MSKHKHIDLTQSWLPFLVKILLWTIHGVCMLFSNASQPHMPMHLASVHYYINRNSMLIKFKFAIPNCFARLIKNERAKYIYSFKRIQPLLIELLIKVKKNINVPSLKTNYLELANNIKFDFMIAFAVAKLHFHIYSPIESPFIAFIFQSSCSLLLCLHAYYPPSTYPANHVASE